MIAFLKSRLVDLILCLLMSLGLIFPIFSGFVLDDFVAGSLIVTAVVSFVVLLICLLFSYNKKTVISGIVIALMAIIGISVYLAQNAILANEADNSLTVSIVVILVTSFLVYLASSSKKGLVVLFLIGNIIIAAAYFLKFPVHISAVIDFDFSMLIAIWYSTYKNSLLLAQAGLVQSHQYVIQSVVIAFVTICLCSGLYFGVVQTINPPTRELKLIEKLQNMEILKQLGIFSQYDQFDPNLLSNTVSNENLKGNIEGEEENQQDGQDEDTEIDENEESQTNGLSDETVKKIKYNLRHFVIPWTAVVVVLLIGLNVYLRYYFKKQWEKRIKALSYENQVINYYYFFIKRLSRTQFKRLKTDTLIEYSQKMDDELSRFDTDIHFSDLTNIYMNVYYGLNHATQEEVQLFEDYYKVFLKGIRKEIGFIKYYLKRLIFRI